MIVGIVLVLLGMALILNNLILGLLPGLILIALGIVAIVVGGLWRGGLAVLRLGGQPVATKTCPECRAVVPTNASFCATCGHKFQ